MTDTIRLELPWPPSVNTYYRAVRGRVLISKKGREYQSNVRMAVMLWSPQHKTLTDRLSVTVLLQPPTRRKFDIDNRMKALLDAMEKAGVYADDEQIDHLVITRGEIVEDGKAVVWINTYPTESEDGDG